MVNPVILGKGNPLFKGINNKLELEAHTLKDLQVRERSPVLRAEEIAFTCEGDQVKEAQNGNDNQK